MDDQITNHDGRQTPIEDRISSLTSRWIDSPQDYDGPYENQCSLNSDNTHLDSNTSQTVPHAKKREVYRYQTEWLISSIAWSNHLDRSQFDLAITSYLDSYSNKVQLVRLETDGYHDEITCLTSFEHPYPATKLLWIPQTPNCSTNASPRLIATSADYLRLWSVNEKPKKPRFLDDISTADQSSFDISQECLLNPNNETRACSPLTSFDWNEIDPRLIVTSSVDTTCALWDIEVSKILSSVQLFAPSPDKISPYKLKSQILAHNHEVYDVSFSRIGSGRDIFVSSGGDSSIRLFDQRHLGTSSVLYESDSKKGRKPYVRVSCSKRDTFYVATFALNSNEVLLLDIRQPGSPITTLRNHNGPVNSLSWASHSGHHICTASDDQQALIWELSKLPDSIEEPVLAYNAGAKINSISWSASHADWIAIGYQNQLELLRV